MFNYIYFTDGQADSGLPLIKDRSSPVSKIKHMYVKVKKEKDNHINVSGSLLAIPKVFRHMLFMHVLAALCCVFKVITLFLSKVF